MKKGTTLLSLTILSLGVYRFSQGFLRQQVQQVSAATVAVGQPVQSVPITGGEINITVKSYPKASTIEPATPPTDESTESSDSKQTSATTQATAEQQSGQTTTESTKRAATIQPTAPVTAQPMAPNAGSNQKSKETAQPAAILAGTTNGQAAPKSKVQQKPTINSDRPTVNSATSKTKQRRDFKKHHAQVEKDIVAFQSGQSGSPAAGGSGGASTNVGVIFGELAGHSLFAVRND